MESICRALAEEAHFTGTEEMGKKPYEFHTGFSCVSREGGYKIETYA